MKARDIQEQRLREEFEARIQPDRKTVRCPNCDEVHALSYRMSARGHKTLCYTCNKVKHFWYSDDYDRDGNKVQREHWRYTVRTFQAPVFIDGLDLFVDWTPAKKKEQQKKDQYQLAIPTTRKDSNASD